MPRSQPRAGPNPALSWSRSSRDHAKWNHIGGSRLAPAIGGPCIHELAPALKGVFAPVRLLRCIADFMRQSRLRNLSRECRLIAGPVAEARSESVQRDI